MNTRERNFVQVGVGIAAFLLFIAFAWIPLERTRTRLTDEVPRLATSVATVERLALDVQRVRAMPVAAAAPATPLATVIASGDLTRDLPGSLAALTGERQVKVFGADVAYGALLEAIGRAQSAHGLRVESARIEALAAPGRVRAELVLARS